MYINTLVTYINESLAGENLSYAELQIHLDSVIDDVNSTLNSVFPAFSEFDATRYPTRYPNYDFFPDKYLRNVVVSGAAFKFYIMDEEGGYAAPQYERRYQQALFEMKRDYLGSVPKMYQADSQGYMKDYEAARGLWLRPGGGLEELPPIDQPNPDLRIYEGRPGTEGKRGLTGRGIQNMWISPDRHIWVRYTDQTEEKVGYVDTLVQGPQGIQGIEGKQGVQGPQGVIGLSGRSLTAMWIDEVNQVWITYDRDYGDTQADTAICIGHIIAHDKIAREQILDINRQIAALELGLSNVSQPDWNQNDETKPGYIKNKPETYAPSPHTHDNEDLIGISAWAKESTKPPYTYAEVGAEPAFTKNTAFNKSFGNTSGSVCEGNDSRLNDARIPLAHTHNPTDINQNSSYRFVSDVERNTWSGKADLSDIVVHDTNTAAHNDIRLEIAEARAVAEGRSRAFSFTTEQAMLDWLAVPENAASLNVGDNLYIEDVDAPDYWWNGTEPKTLGAEKVVLTDFYTQTQVDNLLSDKVDVGDSRLTDARTPLAHTHDNADLTGISAWAKAANKPNYTYSEVGAEPAFSKGTAFNKNFGTGASTVCEGNDARLSDTRTPIAHTHSNADLTGISTWAKAATKPSYTAAEVGAVPTSRTVNGKALSANISLTASDVGAVTSSQVTTMINTAVTAALGDIESLLAGV